MQYATPAETIARYVAAIHRIRDLDRPFANPNFDRVPLIGHPIAFSQGCEEITDISKDPYATAITVNDAGFNTDLFSQL
ncbi:hypothetical protein [uncultured Roseobacter sp.]|uniref:hypothetical protein n=1 Tax=uncultured Roseobacter sp. TaxID=114847 RepID=UPI00262BCEA2|nr:hypothetical protein [uncultured Roseobacter sp.]